jgi:hypothetical protein
MLDRKSTVFILLLSIALFSACNLQNDIDLNLPLYDSQLVVECYLEPGKPYNLLLTQSAGFFDPFSSELDQFLNEILVSDAEVRIEHRGETYILQPGIYFDFQSGKLFNYQFAGIVPADYDEDFRLYILTAGGRKIEAKTRILPVVPIDSVQVMWDGSDTLALALTYVSDDPGQTNYYRRMLHKSSLDSVALQDFSVTDRLAENGGLVFGSGYEFVEGDTIINTLFHIDRAYYEFLKSVQNAVIAGSSPFGAPGKLVGNLEGDAGAVGIFTGLSYDRVVTVVGR